MASHPAAALEPALRLFIQAGTAREFNWTECNCGFWVCEWIKLVRGVDPVEYLRHRFKTATGFRRHVRSAGGNETFSRRIAGRAELAETYTPKMGDVGLVQTERGAMMAIKVDGNKWVAKSETGIVIAPFHQIVAWSL